MHCHRMEGGVGSASGGNSVDAFVDIGTLIVEGRVPAPESTRGFKEGPHCPVATTAQYATHNCDTNNTFLCQRAENLRKHMSLLCSNTVSMCVEVLLCPNCECGIQRAQSVEVANMPSSSDLLLEQWTVSVVHVNQSKEACSMTVKDLFQAVRSQLHFSQLSAWWSSSKGKNPKNICYRITLPGEAFGSQFSKQPIMHSFPMAAISSNICLKVSVSTLPRSESLPILICPVHLDTNGPKDVECSVKKKSGGSEQPMLGESLLDLPGRRPSERLITTSPSAINPKLECDLGGTVQTAGTDTEDRKKLKVMCGWNNSLHSLTRKRQSRQHKSSKPDNNSSLQLLPKEPVPSSQIISGIVDDRMQTNCDLSGKHHCKCEDDTECLGLQDDLPRHRRRSQVATPNLQSSNVSSSSQNESKGSKQVSFNLTQKEVEDVLTVLRSRGQAGNVQNTTRVCNSEARWSKSTKNLPSTSIMPYEDQKIKVPANADLFMSAILRTNFNSDQKFSLKRKFELDDELSGYEQIQNSNLKNGRELNHTNCKKNVHDPSSKNKNDGCDNNKECLFSSVKKTDHCSVTALTNEFRTINSEEQPMCSNQFRTKQCEQKPSITKNKLDIELLDKIQQLDLNKNNEASSGRGVPTALEKAKFRRSLDSAASMVFHWRTGLPLTSSPAPLRRASQRFDYDSSINSVSAISSALFDPVDSLSISSEDTESEGSAKSPSSPLLNHQNSLPWSFQYQPSCSSLLGSFEESVLNGRLEPVSTVQGFTADLGASGSFCPPHLILPVTVFFYTLGDNDKVSTPYLAHINLGKKGYIVPRNGTIQVTLLNPLGTVIKMFVVVYDLADMPVNSHTFLRQRTLYMPSNTTIPECTSQKYLRYLIHLRFSSSKSGRIYLHTDIRMIIFRKSDMDTATGHGLDSSYELRSFTHGPTNPKFSSRK